MSIKIAGVAKRFGDFVALEDIDLDIATGELTALLGPNGGGKSTLLRIIAGLETADSGSVAIEGVDATRLPAQKRNVGFVFQHYAAFRHLTVAGNVGFGLKVRKQPRRRSQLGCKNFSSWFTCRNSRIDCQPSCPVANDSAWP